MADNEVGLEASEYAYTPFAGPAAGALGDRQTRRVQDFRAAFALIHNLGRGG